MTADPILAAIAVHRQAFAEASTDDGNYIAKWTAVDDAGEGLLEAMPATLPDVIELVDYVVELERKHGPNIWPDLAGGDTFHCRLLDHVSAALTRMLAAGRAAGGPSTRRT